MLAPTRDRTGPTCVLFGQFGDVLLVENVLLRGHPVSQEEDDQDGGCGKQQQLQCGSERGHF